MSIDLQKIMQEYGDSFDFGFSTVDEVEYQAVIAEKDETVEEYKARLQQVEKIIMPFLSVRSGWWLFWLSVWIYTRRIASSRR